jgi:hypothetical protein
MIRNWKPWEKSTGPKSKAGKAVSSRNGDKGGLWAELREMRKETNALIQEHREVLRRVVP